MKFKDLTVSYTDESEDSSASVTVTVGLDEDEDEEKVVEDLSIFCKASVASALRLKSTRRLCEQDLKRDVVANV